MDVKATPVGPLQAVARLLGERLRLRDWSEGEVLCPAPLVIRWQGGVVVLFRYGVVVGFGLDEVAWSALEARLAGRSLRVEWYIVLLIVVEIGLTLYELFLRH